MNLADIRRKAALAAEAQANGARLAAAEPPAFETPVARTPAAEAHVFEVEIEVDAPTADAPAVQAPVAEASAVDAPALQAQAAEPPGEEPRKDPPSEEPPQNGPPKEEPPRKEPPREEARGAEAPGADRSVVDAALAQAPADPAVAPAPAPAAAAPVEPQPAPQPQAAQAPATQLPALAAQAPAAAQSFPHWQAYSAPGVPEQGPGYDEPVLSSERDAAPQWEDPHWVAPVPEWEPPATGFDPASIILRGRETASSEEVVREVEQAEATLELLCFKVASEEYAISIMDIKEIIKPREVTEVPRVPGFVRGILSLRGIIIPVFDMRLRLGLPAAQRSEKERVIVVKREGSFCGVLVDQVVQVVRIAEAGVEAPPVVLEGIDREFVQGIGRVSGRMLILLDMEKVLDVGLL